MTTPGAAEAEGEHQQQDMESLLEVLFALPGQSILKSYSCALLKNRFAYHGRLYLTTDYACFYSSMFGTDVKHVIRFASLRGVARVTARFLFLPAPALELALPDGSKLLFINFFMYGLHEAHDECRALLQSAHAAVAVAVPAPAAAAAPATPRAPRAEARGGGQRRPLTDAAHSSLPSPPSGGGGGGGGGGSGGSGGSSGGISSAGARLRSRSHQPASLRSELAAVAPATSSRPAGGEGPPQETLAELLARMVGYEPVLDVVLPCSVEELSALCLRDGAVLGFELHRAKRGERDITMGPWEGAGAGGVGASTPAPAGAFVFATPPRAVSGGGGAAEPSPPPPPPPPPATPTHGLVAHARSSSESAPPSARAAAADTARRGATSPLTRTLRFTMTLSNPLLPSHTVVTQAHRLRFFTAQPTGPLGRGLGLVFEQHATSTLTPFCEYFATEEMWLALPPGADAAPPRVGATASGGGSARGALLLPPAHPGGGATGGCRLIIGCRLVFSKHTVFQGRIRSETEAAVRAFSQEYVAALREELARARRAGEALPRWGTADGGDAAAAAVEEEGEEGGGSGGGGGGGGDDPAHWPVFAQRIVEEQAALSHSLLELREALAGKMGAERDGGVGTLGGLLRAAAGALDGVPLTVAAAALAVLWVLRALLVAAL